MKTHFALLVLVALAPLPFAEAHDPVPSLKSRLMNMPIPTLTAAEKKEFLSYMRLKRKLTPRESKRFMKLFKLQELHDFHLSLWRASPSFPSQWQPLGRPSMEAPRLSDAQSKKFVGYSVFDGRGNRGPRRNEMFGGSHAVSGD